MGWGFWKKLKNGFSKAFNWVKDKVAKPVYDKVIKPVFNAGKNLLPAAGAAISTAKTGKPEIGYAIGNAAKEIGESVIK